MKKERSYVPGWILGSVQRPCNLSSYLLQQPTALLVFEWNFMVVLYVSFDVFYLTAVLTPSTDSLLVTMVNINLNPKHLD